MQLVVTVVDRENQDVLARRIVGDLRGSDAIEDARLSKRGAAPGEKGIVEDLGGVLVTVLDTGGVEVLIGMLKALLPQRRALASDQREIVLETPDKGRIVLKGGMSDEEFLDTKNQLIAFITAERGDAPA